MPTASEDEVLAVPRIQHATTGSSSSGGADGKEHEQWRDDDGAVFFDDHEGGEGRSARILPEVPVPSTEMVRRHRAAGHCPYRAWCPECLQGACNMPAHKAREENPIGSVPEVHGDYGFFRDSRGAKGTTRTVLVLVDRTTGAISANVVPKKGAGGGFAVKQVCRDLRRFGHRRKLLLRSDGENAIKDLLEKVAYVRASETILEHTPVGDSRANGRVERAVQSVEKQVRVLKLATENSVGKFSVSHAIFPWLVLHAADVMVKFRVGADGQTPYERLKGREYSGIMMEFARKVLYKSSAKV